MDNPPLNTRTRATVDIAQQVGLDGAELLVVMVKQRFMVDRRDRVGRIPGAQVRFADEPWDKKKPAQSSVKYPSDVCLRKPGTDVLVVGEALAPYRAKTRELDVLVRVATIEKRLKVFGTRVWYRGKVGLALPPPEPFESVELKWENAFGGFDASDPKRVMEEPRNPVGRGIASNADALLHKPGPQIENPDDLVTSHKSRPVPAGVGALGRHWEPRRAFFGTTDEAWRRERLPLFPADFDERYNQVAPPDLIATPHLRGGERVELVGVSEHGPMRFELPRLAFFVGAQLDDGATIEHRPELDTVLFEPSLREFELTYRAIVPRIRPYHRLRGIQVHEKELR